MTSVAAEGVVEGIVGSGNRNGDRDRNGWGDWGDWNDWNGWAERADCVRSVECAAECVDRQSVNRCLSFAVGNIHVDS